jgi:hypothetical protein
MFIHDVEDVPWAERERLARKGIYVYETAVGAAFHALRLGLLDVAAVRRVVGAAQSELRAMDLDEATRRAYLEAMARDGAL